MNQGSATTEEALDERRCAVEAVVQSAAFRRSPRLRDMLLHVTNATLRGSLEELTETRIAATVFGRPDYNSAEDNLVRVSARQLRAKLAEYYETEGRDDEIVLDVPKGGYVAAFHTRHTAAHSPVAAVNPAVADRVEPRSRRITIVLAGLSVSLLLVSAFLWRQNRLLRNAAAVDSPAALFDVLAPASGQRTDIVLTDSALVLLEQMLHRYVPLEDYASQRYLSLSPDPVSGTPDSDLLTMLRRRQISSLADFRIVSKILQHYARHGAMLSVRHARNMQVRDFENGDNFVLIGSSRSNPWASLFDKPLAFRLQTQFGSSCFENANAARNERRLYCVQDFANEQGTDYAHLALLHTETSRGRVLLIAGADMESTEAAGEFVLNSRALPTVLQALHVRRVSDLPDFELLLKTYSVGGSGRSAELVYARQL